MQLPYPRLRPCFAPLVFSCIAFSFSCLPGIAQVCTVSLTGLSYDNAVARYLIKGRARLDGVAAPPGSILEERLRVSVQFIMGRQARLPMFYQRWEPNSRCFSNPSGCLEDGDIRGSDVRSLDLLVHTFSPDEYGRSVPFSREFVAPSGALKTRVVSQYQRLIHRAPWDRPEQEFAWQKVNEWSRDLLPELSPAPAELSKPSPPEVPPPANPPHVEQPVPAQEVVFDSADIDHRLLTIMLRVPVLPPASMLTGILKKRGEDRVLQEVRKQTSLKGEAKVEFRTFTGWAEGVHEIEIYHGTKFLGKLELDFDKLLTSGNKLAF